MAIRLHFHIAFVKNIAFYVEAQGVAVDRLCQRSGLGRELLTEPDAVVDGHVMERVWEVAVEETGDSNLGLHLGEGIQPAAIGMLGLVMMSCENLQAALLKLIRYWELMSNATRIELSTKGDRATIELQVMDIPGNFLYRNRHPVDSSFSACLSLLQAMAGQRLSVLEAASTYSPPLDIQDYVRVLGVRPRFGAAANIMSFPAEVMRLPLRYANATLVEALEEQMMRRVKRNPVTLQERVRLELVRRLRAQVPSLEAIAISLGVSERAMQRELQLEGTTFRRVIDDLRKDLAAEYLVDSHQSIADISFLLGFSEPSVLHRYFRRWYGVTPATYRAQQPSRLRESEARRSPADNTTPTR